MKISVVLQPSHAVMGEIIKDLLSSDNPSYNKIWLVSAFANAQAIERLVDNILLAKNRGAQISMVVGFDLRSTSVEALRRIDSLGVNSSLVHNARGGHTFHPKIYLFEATGSKAELFIGSNNLTDGGLYTNYEASSQITFNFPEDNGEYAEYLASLDRYLNPQGVTAQILNNELIEILIRRGEIPTEAEIRKKQERVSKVQKRGKVPKSPFGVEQINRPPRLDKPASRVIARKARTDAIITRSAVALRQGDLLWKKVSMPNSDAQQPSKGNPTGGLRLTQAAWKVGGILIDQTTYFRNDIFGNLTWVDWKTDPFSERAEAGFDVYILGKSYGIHELTVSHKPSGEAGQGNYTTFLHWGDLTEIIRRENLVGKTLKLYGPPLGSADPFTIEIE